MDRQKLESLFTSSAFLLTSGFFFINLLLLTTLEASGRGLVGAAYGNTVVLGWVFQVGSPTAAGYFAKDVDHRRTAMSSWTTMLLGGLPVALLLIPFYWWLLVGETFTEGGTSVQRWFIAFIVLQLFNGPFLSAVTWLRGSGNLVRFNFLLALPNALVTLGYFGLWITGNLTVTSALASTFIATATGWAIALIATDSLPGKGFSRTFYKEFRSFALRSWAGGLSFSVALRVDALVLAAVVPSAELGVYLIAVAISGLASPIARGLAQAVQPFIRNSKSDEERIWRATSTLRQVGVLSLLIVLAMAATGPFLIPLLGPTFEPAVVLLFILLPGAWATDLTQVLSIVLSQFNRPEAASKAQIAAAITTVVGLAVLIRPFGVTGAAITTSLSYWVGLLFSYYYWRKLKGEIARGEATGHTEEMPAEELV